MPHGTVREVIPAPSADVFRLLHNYDRRLEWDTLLQAAYLTDGYREAELGAVSVCKGRTHLGGLEIKTKYVSFRPPEVAAVKMVNQPPFFETFAATILHQDLSASSSSVEYKYNFTARPRWLRFILHPLMSAMFAFETKKRLGALKHFFEGNVGNGTLKALLLTAALSLFLPFGAFAKEADLAREAPAANCGLIERGRVVGWEGWPVPRGTR